MSFCTNPSFHLVDTRSAFGVHTGKKEEGEERRIIIIIIIVIVIVIIFIIVIIVIIFIIFIIFIFFLKPFLFSSSFPPPCLPFVPLRFLFACVFVFCIRSMSYTSVSKCPLCRSEFTHLPRVSELLHTVLSKSFPKQYNQRAKETVEFEEEQEIESMSTATRETLSTPDQLKREGAEEGKAVDVEDELFKCDHCGQRLFQPCITSPCSHCLCGTCSGMFIPAEEEDQDQQVAGDSSHGQPIHKCPVCSQTLAAPPQTCHVLNNYLVKRYGDLSRELNLKRRRSSMQSPATASASVSASPRETSEMQERVQQELEMEEGGEYVIVPSVSGRSNAQESRHDVNSGSENQNAGQGPMQVENSNLQERIIRVLKSPCDTVSPENFVHFGVGCDGCGVCPIVGLRYKCTECEERIGFDLCANCHQNHHGPGRFNQQHKPEHTMVLVEAKETLLHSLLKHNPEFSAEHLVNLLNGSE